MKRRIILTPVGYVNNPVRERHTERPESFESVINIFREFAAAMEGLSPGCEIWVIGHLDRADTAVLKAANQRSESHIERGVFSISSPDRPCPVSLSRARILSIDGLRIKLRGLDLLDKTPVLDIKEVRRR